ASVNGEFNRAAWAIVVALICDGLDGRVARMTNTTSKFGVQYDSLSDLVSFGVAPAVMIYLWALQPYGRWGWAAAFLFLICGALRLARFNVQTTTMDPSKFNGLPIPFGAAVLASTVLLYYDWGGIWFLHKFVSPVVVFALAFLMISEVKYESFKKFEGARRHPFQVFVLAILLLILTVVEPQTTLWIVSIAYVSSGPVQWLARRLRARREAAIPPDEAARSEGAGLDEDVSSRSAAADDAGPGRESFDDEEDQERRLH
ncbi:MAG: CDP-diacylglycerol--serine O-phosphatidyltransferase, partial [Candidatus Methylomirabilis sp.]|nr:CDP-diacylglycerol--serine O-phosphatidyltransferase [Deltaproteobacteria bacterium]